jgi:hypothetical protein
MTSGLTRKRYAELLRTLLVCESTGVKPRVMRELLEEITRCWGVLGKMERVIGELQLGYPSLEAWEQNVSPETRAFVAIVREQLDAQNQDQVREPST